ncbi:MAG: YchJ family metal-binding protein [Methylophilus sp.]|nr:YchJ family metal-binding protein [Methylophilus sp.]
MPKPKLIKCPCESGKTYAQCCAPLHHGEHASSAEALMRSRYSAYVFGLEDYLLRTWHPSTRPITLNLEEDAHIKWLGLSIKSHSTISQNQASVEFIARHKSGGDRAERLHETSQFLYVDAWYYLSGEIHAS